MTRVVLGAMVLSMGMAGMVLAEEAAEYRKPPPEVQQVLDAPPSPLVSLSPDRKWMMLVQPASYPSIADLAAPMLRLAGLRVNPQTNGPHRPPKYERIQIQPFPTGDLRDIPIPERPYLGFPIWSPNSQRFAVTRTTDSGIQLYVATAEAGELKRIDGVQLNGVLADEVQWLPDGKTLLCVTIPERRGPVPGAPRAPRGPVVQESFGKSAPVRTFQDLLESPHDEDVFDHYATSQLALVDSESGQVKLLGEPFVCGNVDPSPNGRHLLVWKMRRPYSYLLTVSSFPKHIEVWNLNGEVEHVLAKLPLADQVPIEGVPTGPRSHQWVPTAPATVVWVEALDEGDPRNKVPHRDKLMRSAAPFTDEPQEVWKIEHRYNGITWAEPAGQGMIRDYDRDRRWSRTFLIDVLQSAAEPRLVWDRSIQNRYEDPGTPLMRTLPNGRVVMWQHEGSIFLSGQGASPAGEFPFLDRFDLKTFQTERVFLCGAGVYEQAVGMAPGETPRFLTRRESPVDPPNYRLYTLGQTESVPLTSFEDPTPSVRQITKKLVSYARPDGVKLSFTLYLPPNHREGERLPTVVWAYPQEFNDPANAGQVTGSANRFTRLGGASHLFFALHGYAVLDGATMPVVGDPETANNTFVEQVVASAKAAIDKGEELGVTDPNRVGVGGHSYGAFMAVNLLAHSDLFKAAIARSGAYNRTLTPFGFQNERRTLWEAPDIYLRVSPFLHAHQIKAPVLLIHGADDNNPGTFPIQSERLYHALRGTGGHVRFVSLPHESHGYAARESVEHTLAEMLGWFDTYVRDAKSNVTPTRN